MNIYSNEASFYPYSILVNKYSGNINDMLIILIVC